MTVDPIEATRDLMAREQEIIEGVGRGLADMRAGNTVPHDEAMEELAAYIDGVEANPEILRRSHR